MQRKTLIGHLWLLENSRPAVKRQVTWRRCRSSRHVVRSEVWKAQQQRHLWTAQRTSQPRSSGETHKGFFDDEPSGFIWRDKLFCLTDSISFIHSGHLYSASSSPLQLYPETLPTTALILCRSFVLSEGLAQSPYVAVRAGFEAAAIRSKGAKSTNEPPCPSWSHQNLNVRIDSQTFGEGAVRHPKCLKVKEKYWVSKGRNEFVLY